MLCLKSNELPRCAREESVARNFYNKYYSHMDDHFIRWREITGKLKADNIIRISRGHRLESVLEIGCGTGIIVKTLSEKGFGEKFYAIDISERALDFVKSRNIKGLVEVKRSDAAHISYGDKFFDFAVLSHILEHLQDPEAALQKAKRVARHIVVEVPLENHILRKIKLAVWSVSKRDRNSLPERKIGHIQFFNRKSILRLVESCGLHVESSQIIYLPKRILFFNAKTAASRLKATIKLCLQGFSRLIHFPFTTVHIIMLCRSD